MLGIDDRRRHRRPARRRQADLVFVCTPAAANPDLLRACAAKGIRAAFLTSAGYGEAGTRAGGPRTSWSALADELGILLAGPNGQGVVSTPSQLCAQIVAPVPAGRAHRHRQPVGQLRLVVHELRGADRRRRQPRRVGRQRRRGHASPTTSTSTPTTPRPRSALAYVEGIRRRPRASSTACASVAARKPLVLVKGGATARRASGPRPATPARSPPTTASSTACAARPASPGRPRSRRPSRRRPRSPPSRCPTGNRVVVMTTAGGWGVVTADAIAAAVARAASRCPTTCKAAIDDEAPAAVEPQQPGRPRRRRDPGHHPRGARPDRRRTPTSTPSIYLGLGIQSNQARMMRDGPLLPRPRPRADRRLPRAPGRPLRRGRRRGLATRTASRSSPPPSWPSPIPDNAGPADGARHGTALLRVGQPGRHRARPPLAVRRWRQRRGLD